jgi:hypothetical protein
MRITLRLAAILAAAALAGACGDDGGEATPDARINLPPPDASPTDPDANNTPVCTVTGDYVEAGESGNDPFANGTAEASGQSLTVEGSYTIGGCIDPNQAAQDYVDADAFTFTVGGTDPVWVTLDATSADGTAADGTEVLITNEAVDTLIDGAVLGDGNAVMAPARLDPGTYVLVVVNSTATAPLSYQVTFSGLACTPLAGGTADYVEANDGADNRGNDVATVAYGEEATEVMLTANADDVPEDTGITAAAGMSYLITGNTAQVTPLGDDYLDRDTYSFTTGADVDRAAIIINWTDTTAPDDMDMDWWLWPAGNVTAMSAVSTGTIIGIVDEAVGTLVEPNTEYWLWAGLYNDGPTIPAGGEAYSITVCTY